jgi:hypothetical protein
MNSLYRQENQATVENYRAFLLRCWQDVSGPSGERSAWRFTLVQVRGEKRHRGFACLEDLFAFLHDELENG